MDRIKQTIKTTSYVSNIDIDLIMGRCRERELVDARRMVFSICRDLFHIPYSHIAKYFKLNHATIIHHYRKHEHILRYDRVYEERYKAILELVKADFGYVEAQELINEIMSIRKRTFEQQVRIREQINNL